MTQRPSYGQNVTLTHGNHGQGSVHDIIVQEHCPSDPVGHSGLAYDSGVLTMIGNALDPAHAKGDQRPLGPPP